ncbi:hypothetical protein EUTSA_v10010965mg, partial [Eutrema salsugineum]
FQQSRAVIETSRNLTLEKIKAHIQVMKYCSTTVVTPILGHVVLLYASKYGNIRNVVNISGRYDLQKDIRLGEDYLERIKQEGFIYAKERKSPNRLNTYMHESCLKINKECRVLMVIPVGDAKEFAKIIPNHKLEVFQGANHGYTKHQSQLVSTVMK